MVLGLSHLSSLKYKSSCFFLLIVGGWLSCVLPFSIYFSLVGASWWDFFRFLRA